MLYYLVHVDKQLCGSWTFQLGSLRCFTAAYDKVPT